MIIDLESKIKKKLTGDKFTFKHFCKIAFQYSAHAKPLQLIDLERFELLWKGMKNYNYKIAGHPAAIISTVIQLCDNFMLCCIYYYASLVNIWAMIGK